MTKLKASIVRVSKDLTKYFPTFTELQKLLNIIQHSLISFVGKLRSGNAKKNTMTYWAIEHEMVYVH